MVVVSKFGDGEGMGNQLIKYSAMFDTARKFDRIIILVRAENDKQ